MDSHHESISYLIAAVSAALMFLAACGSNEQSEDVKDFYHKVGVFGITDSSNMSSVSNLGVDLVVTGWPGPSNDVESLANQENLVIIDRTIQSMLYGAVCPNGRQSCQPLSREALNELLGEVRSHLRQAEPDSAVVAWYIVDDYWSPMTTELRAIKELIVAESDLPTVCGVYLPLATRPDSSVNFAFQPKVFETSLANYDPGFCDFPMLYAYAVATPQRIKRQIDWTMESTLSQAMPMLENTGWGAESPWLGVPQAFGDNPRITADGRQVYRPSPTASELAQQMQGMCRSGAVAVAPYAWADGAAGRLSNLSNSEVLRVGWREGARRCRAQWSRAH